MKWFLDLTTRSKLLAGFGSMIALLAVNAAIEAARAGEQNVAGTRQAEAAARNLHEMGQRLKQMALQYKV